MTVRLMVLPVVRYNNGKARVPKYLKSKFNPDGFNVPWSMKDFGLVDWAIVAADLDPTQIGLAQAASDVLLVPENLDTNPTAQGVLVASNFLEAINFPANWVGTNDTWREIVKVVTGGFLYVQSVTGITGVNPFELGGVSLGTQYGSLPQTWQDAMVQGAINTGLIDEGVTIPQTWTLRQIFKWAADQWENTPIVFGKLITL